jgi:hypothetical protein
MDPMRTTDATWASGPRRILVFALLVTALGFGAAQAVGSSGEAPAVSSKKKKKCKKAAWKCAPQRYHLSASGVIHDSNDFTQTWSAEVDLRKYRASIGEVDYSQEGGTVTVSATNASPSGAPSCGEDITFSVPQQQIKVPRLGLNSSDFLLFFDLLGEDKGEYFLVTGETLAPSLSNIQGTGTATCPSPAYSVTLPYPYVGSNEAETQGKGKPGKRVLTGSVTSSGGDSVTWKLTARK